MAIALASLEIGAEAGAAGRLAVAAVSSLLLAAQRRRGNLLRGRER